MFWKYSNKDTKLLLVATLFLFAAFALFISGSLKKIDNGKTSITANSIGVFAEVEQNEINSTMAKLDARSKELDLREARIMNNKSASFDRNTLLVMAVAGFGLFGLILLNFYLDFKRRISLAN